MEVTLFALWDAAADTAARAFARHTADVYALTAAYRGGRIDARAYDEACRASAEARAEVERAAYAPFDAALAGGETYWFDRATREERASA